MGQKRLGSPGRVRFDVIHRARGFSLGSLLVVVIIVVAVAVPALKVIPSLIEYFSIKRAVNYAKGTGTKRSDVAASFDKQAAIDRISSLKGEDLDIEEDETGRIRAVGFEYRTEVQIYGPLSFLITYSGTQ